MLEPEGESMGWRQLETMPASAACTSHDQLYLFQGETADAAEIIELLAGTSEEEDEDDEEEEEEGEAAVPLLGGAVGDVE